MKCEGCKKGLPVVSGYAGGDMGLIPVRLHYTPGSEQPDGLCVTPMMDSVADEVVAWESEGGRATA
jgi:hypothetical protein